MSDELIVMDDAGLPDRPSGNSLPVAGPPPVPGPMDYGDDEEGGSFDPRRLLAAIYRFKWLVVVATILGSGAAFVAWQNTAPEYTASGNLWLLNEGGGNGALSPIMQGGLFEQQDWIELLKSYQVLDPVSIQERLYLEAPYERADVFETFQIDSLFVPGKYRLRVSEAGDQVTLLTDQGVVAETAAPGAPLGAERGFKWTPAAETLVPGEEIQFSVFTPRDASMRLANELNSRMQGVGNFIALSLKGEDPVRIASILNSVMDRHVQVAAELKRKQLEDANVILSEQLRFATDALEAAERELEDFRVNTITLPSDESTPIAPGLELTRDPVFANYFQMKYDLEQARRDEARLVSFLNRLDDSDIPIEALEVIPAAATSSELNSVLGELVTARSALRVLRDGYTEEYPPIQELLATIATLEDVTIPRIVRGIVAQLQTDATNLEIRVDSASVQLAEIPPRTIEEARLSRSVQTQETLYNDLRSRVETGRLAAASAVPDVEILDRAVVPQVPSSDTRITLAAMLLLGSIGGSLALALVLDRLDSRVRYPEQVTGEMGLEVLGSIPRILPGAGRKGAVRAAQVVEAFRELRMRVGFAYGSAGPLTLTVTSAAQSAGKSLIATNLAVAFAEMGKRTLLIDGDCRRGDAHRLLGAEQVPGLTDYLREKESGDIIQSTEYARLDFIPCGRRFSSTPELLASAQMSSFLGTLRRAYDVIIVDSAPLAAGADALILGGLTGNLLMVFRTGATEKQLAESKLEIVSRLPIRMLGAVLNDIEPKGMYRYYSNYLPDYTPTFEGDSDEEEAKVLGPRSVKEPAGV